MCYNRVHLKHFHYPLKTTLWKSLSQPLPLEDAEPAAAGWSRQFTQSAQVARLSAVPGLWNCPAWPLLPCLPADSYWLLALSYYPFVQHLALPEPTELGLLSATGRIEEASGKAVTQKNQLRGWRKHRTCFHVASHVQIFQGLIMWFSSKDCLFFNRTLI